MSIRIDKPWIPFTRENVVAMGGQLGVYELANEEGQTVFIGKAGARTLFGLRGELMGHLETPGISGFRYEVNSAYLTRYQELLMVWLAAHDTLPALNTDDVTRLGRLHPAGIAARRGR